MDSGAKNYRVCSYTEIPKNSREGIIGIEDFVIDQISRMLDSERYLERFKGYLKNILLSLEKESTSALPVLKRKLRELDKEIEFIADTT